MACGDTSGSTTVSTPLDTVLESCQGVCQEIAHLTIGCLQAFGVAARYLSGYLQTLPPPGKPRLVGADASHASHAWVSALVPGLGWAGLTSTRRITSASTTGTSWWPVGGTTPTYPRSRG